MPTVSEIYRQGSIAVYAAATAHFAAAGTRHEIEQAAKMAIVAEVFGRRELCHRPDGAPLIPGSGASISVSHCQTLVVLAADRLGRNIGIDCETASRGAQLGRVAAKFLSAAQSLAWGADEKHLLRAWTLKEAFYKAARIPGLPLAGIPLPPAVVWPTLGGGRRGVEMEFRGNRYSFRPVEFAGFAGDISLVVEENEDF